jgi:predicted RND superfamily exporter protein
MNPVAMADRATPIVVQHGVLGVLMLAASVVTCLLVAAVVILWRSLGEERRRRADADHEHYKWALEHVARATELHNRLMDSQAALIAAVQSTKDMVALGRVSER